MNYSTACAEGELYIHSTAFKIACAYQAIVSIAAIISNSMFIKNEYQLLYFHVNVKVSSTNTGVPYPYRIPFERYGSFLTPEAVVSGSFTEKFLIFSG